MTHILLDARNITDEPSGVARYAEALVPRMIGRRPDWQWTVLRHSSNDRAFDGARDLFVDQRIDGLSNWLRGARTYRRVFGEVGIPDIVHSLFHLLPRKLVGDFRVVVTAHDFIWIDHPEISQSTKLGAATTRLFASRAIPHALRRADGVIAVSEATAQEATRWIARDIIEVIGHGVAERYFEPPPSPGALVAPFLDDGGRYVVAVGNDKYYKNLQTLVRAFARLPPDPNLRLVLVGRCEALLPLARELGVGDRVAGVGFLDDVDLRRVVGHATVFVFPSLVEGFGMPPLEAMALGVPAVVSNLEPMRSVAGDAALHFEPTDVGALAELLRSVLEDPVLRDRLVGLGRRRAGRYDWNDAADRTLALYERLVGVRSR